MNKWYNISWNRVVDILDSNIYKGLVDEQIEKRRNEYGSNQIEIVYSSDIKKNIFNTITTPWFLILISIVMFSFVAKNYLEAVVLVLIILGNLSLKYVEGTKRKKEIKALESLNYANVQVIRGGNKTFVKAEELVVGDIVYIRPQTLIPADIRIIEGEELKLNEKNLTGEGFSVEKYETMIEGRVTSISEIKNIAFRGSFVESGQGKGIVVDTGNSTQLGKILTLLNIDNQKKHSIGDKIEKQISKYYIYIGGLTLTISSLLLIKDNSLENIKQVAQLWFLMGSFGVLGVISIFIKLIKKELLKENIDLKNISIIDTIKDINVFFFDKIGSVTQENMMVKKLYTNHEIQNVESVNGSDVNIKRMITVGILCNNAIYNVSTDTGKGDLIEIALLRFGALKEVFKGILVSKERRIFEIPYDGERRIATSLNRIGRMYRANVKGALDEVLERCTHIMIDGIEKEILEEDIEKIKQGDYQLSNEGLITIGIACRSFTYEPTESENIESNLVFVGIVGIENPIIPESENLVCILKRNYIVPILITDDNKIAATSVGKKLGFISSMEEVISGVELLSLTKEEIFGVLSKVRVFSRITPEIKSKIISIFVEDGYKVASVGENLADIPSITLSNIGIAKGDKPTALVKKMADGYIRNEYLKGFLYLLRRGKKLEVKGKDVANLALKILVYEIFLYSIALLLWGEGILSPLEMLTLNFIIVPGILLSNAFTTREKMKLTFTHNIIDIIVDSIIIFLSLYYLSPYYSKDLICFILIVPMILINNRLNYKLAIKEESINSRVPLLVSATFYLGALVAIYSFGGSVNYRKLPWIILILGVYIIIELLLKKWRE